MHKNDQFHAKFIKVNEVIIQKIIKHMLFILPWRTRIFIAILDPFVRFEVLMAVTAADNASIFFDNTYGG